MTKNKVLFHKYIAQPTDFEAIKIEVDRAEGVFIYDIYGKRYFDFISGISVSNLGHRNPQILKAINAQLEKYLHVMVYGEFIQSPQVLLAKALADNLPANLNCTFFVNSGSEAIEGALKLARIYTKRANFVSFKNAYHGSTLGAMSIIGREEFKQPFEPLLDNTSILEFNNIEDLKKIDRKTACVIIEPFQAGAGVLPAEPEFLLALRKKCTETGSLLVFDEIQSGFGRTGKLFGFQHYNVVPDILCLAKGMGGGMPIAAFVSSFRIMNFLNAGHPLLGHATTFGGHPVCCAASLACLNEILEKNLCDRVLKNEQIIRQMLNHRQIKEIRGSGHFLAIDLQDSEKAKKCITKAIEKGLLIYTYLFNNQCISLSPPLNISESELCEALNILLDVFDEL